MEVSVAPAAEPNGQECVCSPRIYFQRFASSEPVLDEIVQRSRRALSVNPRVRVQEVISAFWGTRQAQGLFYDFHERTPLDLKEEVLSGKTRELLDEYIAFVRKQKRLEGLRSGENEDLMRTIMHNSVADQLCDEGIVPNREMGRIMVSFMLQSKGVEKSVRRDFNVRALR